MYSTIIILPSLAFITSRFLGKTAGVSNNIITYNSYLLSMILYGVYYSLDFNTINILSLNLQYISILQEYLLLILIAPVFICVIRLLYIIGFVKSIKLILIFSLISILCGIMISLIYIAFGFYGTVLFFMLPLLVTVYVLFINSCANWERSRPLLFKIINTLLLSLIIVTFIILMLLILFKLYYILKFLYYSIKHYFIEIRGKLQGGRKNSSNSNNYGGSNKSGNNNNNDNSTNYAASGKNGKKHKLSDKRRADKEAYAKSDKGKATKERYESSDKGKATRERYQSSDKFKATRERYRDKLKKNKAKSITNNRETDLQDDQVLEIGNKLLEIMEDISISDEDL